ncbi:hypothetical protein CC80DRAFT_553694 [Byssothecium circinans]|uniref:Uncharacterized protein n=1 Tax=Byssothecium circinans TaxID=147558 RepID=A0A6A5TEJ7_9PLEO|nr:hypothetical protein CC80DRAFT_553694 [Byssothecium circinans]
MSPAPITSQTLSLYPYLQPSHNHYVNRAYAMHVPTTTNIYLPQNPTMPFPKAERDELPREFYDRLRLATKTYYETQDAEEYRKALHPSTSSHTSSSTGNQCRKAVAKEKRTPVLLQWKENDLADEMEALVMGGDRGEKDRYGDVDMEDR